MSADNLVRLSRDVLVDPDHVIGVRITNELGFREALLSLSNGDTFRVPVPEPAPAELADDADLQSWMCDVLGAPWRVRWLE